MFCVARLNRKLTALQRLSQEAEDEAREGLLEAVVASSKPLHRQSRQTKKAPVATSRSNKELRKAISFDQNMRQ